MPVATQSDAPHQLDFRTLKHTDISEAAHLQHMLAMALQLEFSTIPVYGTALYSITDTSSLAFQHLKSVMIEEMYHVNQAANLLVAVGGKPCFTGKAAPAYPAYLPGANQKTTPYLSIRPASRDLVKDVFMAIEHPAPVQAPAEGKNYDSIGQFYKAIKDGIEKVGNDAFKNSGQNGKQRLDYYIGKQGGKPTYVTDVKTALHAIETIVEQGEGAINPTHPLNPLQPFGSYNHYGQRLDGTYGPILGTPFELSHYYKFKTIADKAKPFPPVRPTVSTANINNYENSLAVMMANAFDMIYSVMLHKLEFSFQEGDQSREVYFQLVLPIMHEILPVLARAIMQVPIWTEGDASIGPNALPLWNYIAGLSLASFREKMVEILNHTNSQFGLEQALQSIPGALDRLTTSAKTLGQE
jgi:rubrerythrin